MNFPMTLEQYISQGSLNERQLARLGADVADALSVIHQQRMIHGHIKPGNVEMRADGSFRLMAQGEPRNYPQGVYQVFVAPEIQQGASPSPVADIFALGAMMREMVSHQGVNMVLRNCIDKACSPDPQMRYQSAYEMYQELMLIYDSIEDTRLFSVDDSTEVMTEEELNAAAAASMHPGQVSSSNMPPRQAPAPSMNMPPRQAPAPGSNMPPRQAPAPSMNMPPRQAPAPGSNMPPRQAPAPSLNIPPQAARPNMNMPPQAARPNMNMPPQHAKAAAQKGQQQSLALSFILPIMIVLILGSAALAYFVLIKPGMDEKKNPTTTELAASTNDAQTTAAADPNATTQEAAATFALENYVGADIQAIQSQLEAQGIVVTVQYETSDTVAENMIISQSFPAGTNMEAGQELVLTVSQGDGCPYEYRQKVTVSASAGNTAGTLTLYNWQNGTWVAQFSCGCRVGKNGIGTNYGEGKGITPEGTFKLGYVLTTYDPGNGMPYKPVSSTTCVVDDTSSPLYNIICDTSQVPSGVSKDPIGSNITSGKMSGAIFIEHNGNGVDASTVTPGRGSVITICGMNKTLAQTAGCVDITNTDFSTLLRNLDGTKNPYIEIIEN